MFNRIQYWLADNGFGNIVRQEPVSGGCINNTARLFLDKSKTLILKHYERAPDGMFYAEAAGLDALKKTQALRIPEVIHVDDEFLILEDLGQSEPAKDFWRQLGTGLAKIHNSPQSQFGFYVDNYCGSTPQVNTPTADGFAFFAEYRILSLAAVAFQRNLLSTNDLNALETIALNLSKWIPKQAAVLIHGDLWSGNIHCDEHGQPALIDPAVYWGWAEAELAMTQLFGDLNHDFYASYAEHSDMDVDLRERAPLYNLYHLLNHLLLFGRSYHSQIRSVTTRYAA